MNLNYLIYFIVFAILAFVILVTFRTLGKVKKFKDNNETITEKNLKNKSEVSGKIIDEIDIVKNLNELNKLHSQGVLNDEEFKKAKEKILK